MDNRAPQVVALLIPFSIIPAVAVVLRIWSRALIITSGSSRTRGLWWDDWLVLMDLVSICHHEWVSPNIPTALRSGYECARFVMDHFRAWKTHGSGITAGST